MTTATQQLGPLEGLRVLEVSSAPGAAFLGRMLADRGAAVFQLLTEPEPESHPAAVDVGYARTVALDFAKHRFAATRQGPAWPPLVERLLENVDVVVVGAWALDDLPPEFAPSGLAAGGASIVASILPYGAIGPRAHWRGSPLTASASSGLMSVSGAPEGLPQRPWGVQESYFAAMLAYSGVMAALFARRRGATRNYWLDASVQEAGLQALECGFVGESYLHVTRVRRNSTNPFGYPYEVYPCLDGFVLAAIGHDWPYFAEILDEPGLNHPDFETLEGRMRNRPRLDALLTNAFATHTAEELLAIGQAVRCPFGAVYRPSDLLAKEHWAARSSFATVEVAGRTARVPASAIGATFHAEAPSAERAAVLRDQRLALPGFTIHETRQLEQEGVISWHNLI
jgi:crotonobetainyl-CoA:carnitine CoA-transferase CaiB-like acyl-CoA transferase